MSAGQWPVEHETPSKEMKQNMTWTNGWVAGLATPMIIVMFLLFAGSPIVKANDQPSGANAEVKIDNFSFGPETIKISVRATVTWTNHDDIPHTVVSAGGVFRLQGAGYGRQVLLHLYQSRNVSLLLLGPFEDTWEDRGAVTRTSCRLYNGSGKHLLQHSLLQTLLLSTCERI
jgi:plastocyanin